MSVDDEKEIFILEWHSIRTQMVRCIVLTRNGNFVEKFDCGGNPKTMVFHWLIFMKQILLSAHIVITVLLLSACGGGSKTSSVQEEGDTLKMRYTTNLSVVKVSWLYHGFYRNPWDTLKILHTYLLTDKTQPVPENLPEGTVVRVPLEQAVVYSVVHGSVLKRVGTGKKYQGSL